MGRRLVVVAALFMAVFTLESMSYASEKEHAADLGGKMMMEHININCVNCHGKSGPKGMMMEHEGISCLTCHSGKAGDKSKTVKKPAKAKTPLKNKMMLEHVGMKCSNCHGEGGPKKMMMEHEGIDCLTCHPMEKH